MITVTIQADEKLLKALSDLSHSLKLFAATGAATGNVLGEVAAEASKQSTPTPAAVPVQPEPAQAVPTAPPTTQTAPTTQSAPQATAVPVAPADTGQAPAAVPTTEQSYTLDQLAVAATQLVDAGRREELVQLLGQFGVQALTALPKEQYGAFATALRQMGAKI